jgi:hypothetical protein
MSGLSCHLQVGEVGEHSAHPLGFYLLSLVERRYTIVLRGTETKGFRNRQI